MSDMNGMEDLPTSWTDKDIKDFIDSYDPLRDEFASPGQSEAQIQADLDELFGTNFAQAQGESTIPRLPQQYGDASSLVLSNEWQQQMHYGQAEEGNFNLLTTPWTPDQNQQPYSGDPVGFAGLDLCLERPQESFPNANKFESSNPSSPSPATIRPSKRPAKGTPISTPTAPAYERRFNTFEAAHAALTASNTPDHMIDLDLPNDDWQTIQEHHIHAYASRLFHALSSPPTTYPPCIQSPYHKTYWRTHQAHTLTHITTQLTASPALAEARTLLFIEQVLLLHAHGCPASIFHRTNEKHGYKFEGSYIASLRLEHIIANAAADKYFAQDILSGTHWGDIVRAPAAYLVRKSSNSRVNAKKAETKALADGKEGGRGAVLGRKRGAGVVRDLEMEEEEDENEGMGRTKKAKYPTPGASSPVMMAFGDVGPIPFSFGTGAAGMD